MWVPSTWHTAASSSWQSSLKWWQDLHPRQFRLSWRVNWAWGLQNPAGRTYRRFDPGSYRFLYSRSIVSWWMLWTARKGHLVPHHKVPSLGPFLFLSSVKWGNWWGCVKQVTNDIAYPLILALIPSTFDSFLPMCAEAQLLFVAP